MVGKFIGDRKIAELVELNTKTMGSLEATEPIVEGVWYRVVYEDRSEEVLPKILFDKIVSEVPCDATELRSKRVIPIVEEVLKILLRYGLRLSEIEYLNALVRTSVEQAYEEAESVIWGTKIKTLFDIHRVLKSKRYTLKDILGQ